MTLSILINAATLKGYLLAKEAPAEMVALAQGIVETTTSALSWERFAARVPNEDAKLHAAPAIVGYSAEDLKLDLSRKIMAASEKAPRHDDSRFAAPDTAAGDLPPPPPAELPQESVKADDLSPPETANAAPETTLTEENAIPSAPEDAEDGNDAPVSTGGAIAKARHGGRGHPKLEASMLPAIKEALAIESFGTVGAEYGVTGQSIVNFLNRHGVDHRDFRKKIMNRQEKPGKSSEAVPRSEVNADTAPLPAKSAQDASLTAPKTGAGSLTDEQKAKVREMHAQGKALNEIATKVGRRKFGAILKYHQSLMNESLSFADAETVIDEQGRKVTRCPPGFARGVYPQKSVNPTRGG